MYKNAKKFWPFQVYVYNNTIVSRKIYSLSICVCVYRYAYNLIIWLLHQSIHFCDNAVVSTHFNIIGSLVLIDSNYWNGLAKRSCCVALRTVSSHLWSMIMGEKECIHVCVTGSPWCTVGKKFYWGNNNKKWKKIHILNKTHFSYPKILSF